MNEFSRYQSLHLKKSDFFDFGIIPKVCIHSLQEDEYSKFYIPIDKCNCGCNKWVESEMNILKSKYGYSFPKKKVHRCAKCNEVRLANKIEGA
jgi:hypothetical protein